MQKWEYCVVGPIRKTDDGIPKPNVASRTMFGQEGKKVRVIKDVNDDLALVISKLGMEGWELVGTGNTSVDTHFLYFKRPLE